MGEVKGTRASTDGLKNQRSHPNQPHISWPLAQFKRAGSLGITDMQLLKKKKQTTNKKTTQVDQLERKANHTPKGFLNGGRRINF